MPFIAKAEIRGIYKETTSYPFDSPYIHTIIENLGMSMKGLTSLPF